VDDIMFVGSKTYWQDVFLKRMSEKFSISHSQLDGVGTSVSFLRRKVTDMGDWLMLTPGISISKVVKVFEESFGVARAQKIPCSAEIQMEDVSQKLNPRDATAYRSIVGLCLYIGRERPDLMFTIKELAGGMSSPTLTGLQRLRKLVGYMKHVGDVGVKLVTPLPGQGKFSNDGEHFWVWKHTVTLTGVQIDPTDAAHHVGCIFLTIPSSTVAAGLRKQFHFLLVRVSFTAW
jgi:hypothetical protein